MSIFNGLKIKKGVLIECSKHKRKVTIPKCVKKIKSDAFENCNELEEVVIKSKINSIPACFSYCKNLKSVTLPDTLTEIGSHVFSGCVCIKNINLPKNIAKIGNAAFSGCTSLESIIIPPKVTVIRKNTFENCENLTDVIMHDNISEIESSAFKGCVSLKSISIPLKVTVINSGVFENCKSLADAGLHSNITTIKNNAYRCCVSLTKVTIPESVKLMDRTAFSDCLSLESLSLCDEISDLLGNKFGSSAIQEKLKENINESVKLIVAVREPEFYIKNKTLVKYEGSCSFNTVYVPRGVEHIATNAFKGYNYISHIVIPDSVKTIEKNMFLSCSGLESISFLGCPEFSETFSYESNLKNIFIPSNRSKSDYKIEIAPEIIQATEEDFKWATIVNNPLAGMNICAEGPVVYDSIKRVYKKQVKVAETETKHIPKTWEEMTRERLEIYAEVDNKWKGVNIKASPISENDYAWDLHFASSMADSINPMYEVLVEKTKWIEVEVPARAPSYRRVSVDKVSKETYDWYKDIKVTELKDGVYDSKSRFVRNLD